MKERNVGFALNCGRLALVCHHRAEAAVRAEPTRSHQLSVWMLLSVRVSVVHVLCARTPSALNHTRTRCARSAAAGSMTISWTRRGAIYSSGAIPSKWQMGSSIGTPKAPKTAKARGEGARQQWPSLLQYLPHTRAPLQLQNLIPVLKTKPTPTLCIQARRHTAVLRFRTLCFGKLRP